MRKLAAFALVAAGVSVLSFVLLSDETGTAANRDYIAYWAAGRLLVRGGNPYDAAAVLALEKSAGFVAPGPLIMRNPPWALWVALPLGFLGVNAGGVLWCAVLMACIIGSVHLVWWMYGRPPNRLHLAGYVFAPTVACLLAGQSSALALLGLTLFLSFHRTRPVVAGMCTALLAVKPHIFLLFGVVLLAWALARRAYSLLAGAAAVIAAAAVFPLLFAPAVWRQYFAMMKAAGIESDFIPAISTLVRVGIDRGAVWPQFLLAAAGFVWALWYLRRHWRDWDWKQHGSLLLLVSVAAAPYAWFTDEIVLVPAILHGIYSTAGRGQAALFAFGALDAVAMIQLLLGVPLGSGFYLWTSAAWLLWYTVAVQPGCAGQAPIAACTVDRRG